jgi:hypothetical protein
LATNATVPVGELDGTDEAIRALMLQLVAAREEGIPVGYESPVIMQQAVFIDESTEGRAPGDQLSTGPGISRRLFDRREHASQSLDGGRWAL